MRDRLRRFGRDHLLRKLVGVEPVAETDRVAKLHRRAEELERAVGQSAAERLLVQDVNLPAT